MEAGEFENRKAFEEVTTKNVKTGVDYSTDTRKLFRELEKKVEILESMVRSQSVIIEQFKIQLAGVQTKLFSGGTD